MNSTAAKPLIIFGCVHIGGGTADLKMAKKYVDFAKESRAHVLILGDNFEAAIPSKKHMAFTQNMTTQEQYDYGVKLFAPIAHQVVGASTSNHSMRVWKETGMDMDKTLAERLGYSDRYDPYQGFVSLKVGLQEYKIAFTHGSNCGSDTFRDSRRLLRSFPRADICASSHSHRLSTLKEGFWDVEGKKKTLHEVTFIITGSLLDYPVYADQAGYSPQPKGFAIAWLHPREKHVSVDVSGRI